MAEVKETPKFVPKPTGISRFSHRFWYIVTLPLRRSGPAFAFVMTVYIIGYNVGVRWWKGPDHPVNRFTWRRMEAEGLLSEEMLNKKKTVLDYYKSRLFGSFTDSYSSSDAV